MVKLLELFSVAELQSLQDSFSTVAEIATVITLPDGTPVTQPTNFTRFCQIIRSTSAGCAKCLHSDEVIGRPNPLGPNLRPCLSAGLVDAGVGIRVGEVHIANWLIGQVRDGSQSVDAVAAYADEIGVDEFELMSAYLEVPLMSREKFQRIAESFFSFANELSQRSYEKFQQLRLQEQLVQTQRDKTDALARLVSGVAHEINTPLGAIASCTTTIASATDGILSEVLTTKYGAAGLQRELADWLLGLPPAEHTLKWGPEREELSRMEDFLGEAHCQKPAKTAEELLALGFPRDLQSLKHLVSVANYEEIVSQVSRFSDMRKATKIIDEATKKAAQFVTKLQSSHEYLNPLRS